MLELPIRVLDGFLGKFRVKFPWNKMTSEAVTVEIEDVFLLAVPLDKDNWDEVEVFACLVDHTFSSANLISLNEDFFLLKERNLPRLLHGERRKKAVPTTKVGLLVDLELKYWTTFRY